MKLRSSEAFSSGSSASISRTEVATFLATRKRPSLQMCDRIPRLRELLVEAHENTYWKWSRITQPLSPFFSFPVFFDVGGAPGGEVDVLGPGEDDEAVPDPADGEVCRLPVRLVRAHNSATVARSSILNLQCIAHSQMLHGPWVKEHLPNEKSFDF